MLHLLNPVPFSIPFFGKRKKKEKKEEQKRQNGFSAGIIIHARRQVKLTGFQKTKVRCFTLRLIELLFG